MGKNRRKRQQREEKKHNKPAVQQKQQEEEEENDQNHKPADAHRERLTLEALDAISDEEGDESGDGDDYDDGSGSGRVISTNNEDDGEEEEWNAEARALRQAIAEGAFDKLLGDAASAGGRGSKRSSGKTDLDGGGDDDDDDDDGSVQEEVLGESSDDSDREEGGTEEEAGKNSQTSKFTKITTANVNNTRALLAKTAELSSYQKCMPWVETFDVVPTEPLPFNNNDGKDGNPVDVHDDLKREVAFYNMALESVQEARKRCKEAGVPFSRPDDFFAEMVKSDDHMAKVKDRLIFETKKMQAFEQRKANREHMLRAKETQTKKQTDKARQKKEHMRQVASWAESAAASRPSGGRVRDGDEDDMYLRSMQGGGGGGKSKKRLAADKKYGFGGKKGRFKQMDQKMINDMSDYNPRGNFGGVGSKKSKKGGGSGANRKGKRARDAARQRR